MVNSIDSINTAYCTFDSYRKANTEVASYYLLALLYFIFAVTAPKHSMKNWYRIVRMEDDRVSLVCLGNEIVSRSSK